jgi:hypothetical protein
MDGVRPVGASEDRSCAAIPMPPAAAICVAICCASIERHISPAVPVPKVASAFFGSIVSTKLDSTIASKFW